MKDLNFEDCSWLADVMNPSYMYAATNARSKQINARKKEKTNQKVTAIFQQCQSNSNADFQDWNW